MISVSKQNIKFLTVILLKLLLNTKCFIINSLHTKNRVISFSRFSNNVDKLISDIPVEERGIGVGVDLGTTNSCVAILDDNGIPKIIPVQNCRTIPSIVSLNTNNQVVKVGHHDENADTSLVYRHVKRIIGQGCTMASKNINIVPQLTGITTIKKKRNGKEEESITLEKQLLEAKENPAVLKAPSGTISPEEISSHVLKSLFHAVEKHVGNNQIVSRAVIGVPAYFNDAQREATIKACELAGVKRVRLLREPEAAALAYGIGRNAFVDDDDDNGELVLVFDLGGGTYDVSMLYVSAGLIEVVATAGNNMLGGSDFDLEIAKYFSRVIMENVKENLFKDLSDIMLQAAERVRISLTNNKSLNLALPKTKQGWVDLPYPGHIIQHNFQEHNETHVFCQFTRSQMETLNNDLFQQLLKPIREVAIMSQALLPGDARPSIVQAALSEEANNNYMDDLLSFDDFYESENQENDNIDSNTLFQLKQVQSMDVKALRKQQQKARKQARQLQTQEKNYREQKRNAKNQISQKSTDSKNVKVQDGIHGKPISQVILVGGATRMPAIGRLLGAITGVTPKKTVHPDEAVALGCAVQAGILDGGGYNSGLQVLTPMQAAIVRAMAKKKGMNIST